MTKHIAVTDERLLRLRDQFINYSHDFLVKNELSDDNLLAFCLDLIIRIHLTTSAPHYTDDHLLEYFKATIAAYRESFKKRAN